MKKTMLTIFCFVAILATSIGLNAQEITITLNPGWTWISYPNAEAMDITTALGDFVPVEGDVIKSQNGSSSYINGRWRGGVSHFIPGKGYMYYSARSEETSFVFAVPPQINIPTGAINGKFTINADGDQVYFSQGNLQYIGSAAEPYWKFAENQWDCLGTTTGQNSNVHNVDRDLFGWGTSGWDCGNTYYHPWDILNSSGSSYGPTGANNLTGAYANSDWGVYNPISNGGNQPNQWRTPTKEEWGYVFDTRTTASGIRYAKANVNAVNGVILLPDDWNTNYYSLSDTNTNDAEFSVNTITASEWSVLEQHGAVFLPATGYRFGASVKNVGSRGYYWSSSYVNGNYAYGLYFYDSDLNPQDCSNRTYGRGIRLVHVVE